MTEDKGINLEVHISVDSKKRGKAQLSVDSKSLGARDMAYLECDRQCTVSPITLTLPGSITELYDASTRKSVPPNLLLELERQFREQSECSQPS